MSWTKQNIKLKTPEQIAKMQSGADVLVDVFRMVRDLVQPGKTTQSIDEAIEKMIRDVGCIPSFKGYNGFPASACIASLKTADCT